MSAMKLHAMRPQFAKILQETLFAHVLTDLLEIQSEVAAENQVNASLISIVQIQHYVKIQNAKIHVNLQRPVEAMQFVEPLVTLFHADAHQILEEIRKFHVISLSAKLMMNAIQVKHVLIPNVLTLAHCQMLVVVMQIACLKIMLEYVHVYQEQQEILCWDVFNYNIVMLIINVQQEQNVTTVFVELYVPAQEIV